MGVELQIETGEPALGGTKRRCPDISKAERELSYKPQVLLKDGLKITIKWYKNHFENGVSKDEFG